MNAAMLYVDTNIDITIIDTVFLAFTYKLCCLLSTHFLAVLRHFLYVGAIKAINFGLLFTYSTMSC